MAEPEITAAKILSEVALPPQADPDCVAGASASARSNQIFPSFKADTLKPFTPAALNPFRTYIGGMSRIVDFTGNVIGYPSPRSLPDNHGHAMRNEADVRTFANSLYIDPAKAVMLEMLPDATHRTYDWVFLSEAMPPPTLSVEIQSIPGMALAKRIPHLNSTHSQVDCDLPVLLIEFKAPSVVFLARNLAQSHGDESPDWKAMTKQLRKYAVLWKCRCLILMNERLACFFYPPAADLMDPNQSIHYLSTEAPVVGIDSTLSGGLPPPLAVTSLIAQTPIDSSSDPLATGTQISNASSSNAILLLSIDGPSVATPNDSAAINQVRPIAAPGPASTGNSCIAGKTGSTLLNNLNLTQRSLPISPFASYLPSRPGTHWETNLARTSGKTTIILGWRFSRVHIPLWPPRMPAHIQGPSPQVMNTRGSAGISETEANCPSPSC